MTRLHELSGIGQAIWLDYIRRSSLEAGELKELIKKGVRGVTSNPSIFEKAIAGSNDYDNEILMMAREGRSAIEIYENLIIKDIQMAADQLRPLYEETQGSDGFVSVEVSPMLANDTNNTINEAKRLFKEVSRPNVMIKIPATSAGFPAIEAVIAYGINVNITLIFSLEQYEMATEAYISGLEKLFAYGRDINVVASVASFFVSRVDTAVDKDLLGLGYAELGGKAAVDNAKLAYARFLDIFSGERWDKLALIGGKVQRPLWASTGRKNPAYSDTIYIDNLIGQYTVNTVPPATLEAFLDHGKAQITINQDIGVADERMKKLEEIGIDLSAITKKLLDDGVMAFSEAYKNLIHSIEIKRMKVLLENN